VLGRGDRGLGIIVTDTCSITAVVERSPGRDGNYVIVEFCNATYFIPNKPMRIFTSIMAVFSLGIPLK
jgi:hypothetical protein